MINVPTNIEKDITTAVRLINDTSTKIRDLYKGRLAKIVCPRYNGQIFGSSKPKLEGRVVRIKDVTFNTHGTGGGLVYFFCELRSTKNPNDWLWLDEALTAKQLELIEE